MNEGRLYVGERYFPQATSKNCFSKVMPRSSILCQVSFCNLVNICEGFRSETLDIKAAFKNPLPSLQFPYYHAQSQLYHKEPSSRADVNGMQPHWLHWVGPTTLMVHLTLAAGHVPSSFLLALGRSEKGKHSLEIAAPWFQ